MEKVKCCLFGQVMVSEGDDEIFIPTGRVSELFYYLAVKKIARREELVGLLWPDTSDENAKNSLRNTLHKLKKYFKADLFLTPNKSLIVINESIDFEVDVDELSRAPQDQLALYRGDFLAGVTTKNSFEYETWLMETREYYRALFINNAQRKMASLYDQKCFEPMEALIRQLLIVDGFNETAFLYLMRYYQTQGRCDKIINEYYHLQKILEDELGIDPSEEIEELFQQALNTVRKKDQGQHAEVDEGFFYREYEYHQIQSILDDFNQGAAPVSIMLKGETGAGKSTLKKKIRLANQSQFNFLEIQCSLIERAISYSPWMKVISLLEAEMDRHQIKRPTHWKNVKSNLFFDGKKENFPTPQILETTENFNADLIFKSIQSALKTLGEKKKMVIILEDIQWFDQYSLRLLLYLILNSGSHTLFLLTTSDEVGDSIENISTLVDLNKLAIIELKRFSQLEVTAILKNYLKIKGFTQKIADEIYEKSRGNAFFLKVYIDSYLNHTDEKSINKVMQNVLKDKFTGLDETAMRILKLLCVFNGDVKLEFLLELLSLKAFAMIDSINELIRFNILEEKRDEEGVTINFAHGIYREYLYGDLSETTKLLMHREIGQALERRLSTSGDIQSYLKLRYHFGLANDKVRSLKYEVIILYYHLNFSHELFPSLDDFELSQQIKLNINNERAMTWIRTVEDELRKVINLKVDEQSADIERIEMIFYFCKGRYLIRCGMYQEGVRMIRKVIALSEHAGDLKSELQGHKQMIIYGIQTNQPEIMLQHIINGIKAARSLGNLLESGVLYRLYGVFHLMQGHGGTAEVLFMKSITLLETSERPASTNSVNLAANYNYLGEIRNLSGEFDEAMDYYKKAISLCEYYEPSSLSIFYINAGKTCFLMDNVTEMAMHLNKAKKILDQFDSFWKKPVHEALSALYAYRQNDFEAALRFLKNSMACVNTINNSRDIGMVYFVQAIIRKGLETDHAGKGKDLEDFLAEPSSVYFFNALKNLDHYRDQAEIEHLRKLM